MGFLDISKVKRSRLLVSNERSCYKKIHMWNMETLASTLQKLWSRLPILKCRSNSKVKDKGTEWYPKKGLVTRMNYVKYECTNPNPFKVTVKVCFLKVGQTPRSRSKFLVSYKWSSQNDYIYVSMKALSLPLKSYGQG